MKDMDDAPGPACDLCEAARITPWYHEDDVCWIAECEICAVPMVVWRKHGREPAAADLELALAEPARVKKVLYHLADHLEAAYYVEINLGPAGATDADYYSYVISARDGRLLFRHNLTAADSFTYRVWADAGAPQGACHPVGLDRGADPARLA